MPYGVYNGTVEERAKLPLIQWDVDSRDWENRNAAILAKSVIQKAKPGSIILLHDLHPWSVDAVPSIID